MILSHLSYFLVWIEEHVYKTSTWPLGTNEYISPFFDCYPLHILNVLFWSTRVNAWDLKIWPRIDKSTLRSAWISWLILDTSNGCMFHSLSTIICFARSNPHWCICEISQWWEISYAVIPSDQFGYRITIMLFPELLYKQKINRTPSARKTWSHILLY